ncbi:hypothetical protein PBI_U2_44 [Mycobacterium phage U2]|uniref:Uncharacterized protein n=3 Tax=Fromanvirus TaxID=186764 RepID=Q5J5R1_9CAUD|nr:hypothetical protein PBI_U2_44 [Mycobacterium phage U2]YP_001491696.1 gp44 [Mycobacterium phage Bethlehem]YP_009607775.1 hypothetical protein FDI12_gp46 [Mycobacterium phage Switzer]AXH47508.1 hypothetical protein SEA_HOPE4EVER_47 [Mycobacterium phage Hope4ever]QJD53524.1 hypothetical protein SEA_MANATEE_46 [Mycobacterium phage Manatee]AAR89683.1 hypothetical protein PBI_U2_44 [Mycobacterium phage U2]AAR89765.1 hypothetical protein PBI_BETHLEHEM_45 [Mycobacterium phage Bethlehem]AEK10345.
MNLPDLPDGHRWEIYATKSYGSPHIVAKIKKGWCTKAEARSYPDIWGVERATEKSVKQAYESFMFNPEEIQKRLDVLLDPRLDT